MSEDLEASITQWGEDLYALEDRDSELPLTAPDFTKRDIAGTSLRFVINARPEYRQMAQTALDEGLAQREIVDQKYESEPLGLGCMLALYGTIVAASAAMWGIVELAQYLLNK